MKSKLSGLEPFDTNHLIAIFLSLFIILLVPIVGKIFRAENRTNFIYFLISFAVIQEIVDYVSRYNSDGFNLAEDLPLNICSYALIMSCMSLYSKISFVLNLVIC